MDLDFSTALSALRRLKVQTGSLACLGCGMEHNCSTQGCVIIRDAATHMELALEKVRVLDASLDTAEEEIRSLHSELATIERCKDEAYSLVCKERDDLEVALDGAKLSMMALNEKLVKVTEERDSAVEDMRHMLDNCKACVHEHDAPEDCDCECVECKKKCPCGACIEGSKFEWRGAREEQMT